MTDNATNAASPAAAAPEALKSTDTSALKATTAPAEAPDELTPNKPKPKPAAPKPAPKPAPAAASADDGEAGEETGEHSQESDAANADGQKRKPERLPRWVQERMARAELVAERRAEERLRREFEQRYTPQQAAPQTVNVDAQAERDKTLADFDFDQDAYFDYKVEQGIKRREAQAERVQVERKQAEAAEQFKAKIDDFETRIGAGAWEDIESSPLNRDPAFKQLTELFMGDEHDLDIALHLAQNIHEAERINALPTPQRVREVAKLAALFEGETQANVPAPVAAAKPAPIPKKLTNAPPPPKTVSGAGKPSASVDDEGISPADRIALWQAKRRGR